MKYFVWELDEDGSPTHVIQLLSDNKKKLRGKWQMFVKETIKNEVAECCVKGYHLTTDSSQYAVYDDRQERVFKKG